MSRWKSEDEALNAIAEAAAPAGRRLGPVSHDFEKTLRRVLKQELSVGYEPYRLLLRTLDWAAVPLAGRPLSHLPLPKRQQVLKQLLHHPKTGLWARSLTAPLKLARFRGSVLSDDFRPPGAGLRVLPERARWESQIEDAQELDFDEEIEVDVVVVGTGAGGAPIAHRLAARGHAVLMLEAGGHFPRSEFGGLPLAMQSKLYRDGGATFTRGNTVIPLPMGKTVGGTTTINSGTCYRLPASVHHRWALQLGLDKLGQEQLSPYYDRVEEALNVEVASTEQLGKSALKIAMGAEALGYEHGPLRRNAPGCDGQGMCCFGCPTDAKRSTNVSYVPRALERGAMLYQHAEVREILMERGQAVGVRAQAKRADGRTVNLRVRAKAVVLSAGAIYTPALLMHNGLSKRRPQLGKNLTIHPAGHQWALFDDEIRGWEGIPQGYAIEEFRDQGLRFEGGFLPPSIATLAMNTVGDEFTERIEAYDRMALFGFMIAERSRGQVRLGIGGRPSIEYNLCREDVHRIIDAHAILARVFLAAGARRVHPGLRSFDDLRSEQDIAEMQRLAKRELSASDLDLSAYHPLGTCRMAATADQGVVGMDHQVYGVPGLFISDGSVVPGPLGVNPQLTIMAFAERAASFVEARVMASDHAQGHASAARVAAAIVNANEIANASEIADESADSEGVRAGELQGGHLAHFEFSETMSGQCRRTGAEEDGPLELEFSLTATIAPEPARHLWNKGGTLSLRGEMSLQGLAEKSHCEGTLLIRPLQSTSTLVYDLVFEAEGGKTFTLHGEKHVTLGAALAGITTLYIQVYDPQGALWAEGEMLFPMAQVTSWLRSFQYRPSRPPTLAETG